jgi:hypothetical protein
MRLFFLINRIEFQREFAMVTQNKYLHKSCIQSYQSSFILSISKHISKMISDPPSQL